MNIKTLFTLPALLLAGIASAATITTPYMQANTADNNGIQCQLTNSTSSTLGSLTKPDAIIMTMYDSYGNVVATNTFTTIAPHASKFGTWQPGTSEGFCVFTIPNKNSVRAGIVQFGPNSSTTMYLKAE